MHNNDAICSKIHTPVTKSENWMESHKAALRIMTNRKAEFSKWEKQSENRNKYRTSIWPSKITSSFFLLNVVTQGSCRGGAGSPCDQIIILSAEI